MEKKTKLDLIKEGYETARDNKPEKKYPIGGYAPGNYHNRCSTCERSFFGDKRSVQCESCAVESLREILRPYDQATPQGIGWVKANKYDISKGGLLFYRFDGPALKSLGIGHFVGDVFYGINSDMFPKWDWDNLYLLDETGQSQQPEREVNKVIMEFIRDVAENWDCDEDGHKYNTGCRKCSAAELLYDLTKAQKEVKP
jgi:hypothetical protein